MKFITISLFVAYSVLFAREVNPAFLWDATVDTTGRVITNATEETYWYELGKGSYDDCTEVENSDLIWPSDVKEDVYGDFFGPLTRAYGGIVGEFMLGENVEIDTSEMDGFVRYSVGIGFNTWNLDQESVDISVWNGFCLEYSSTMRFHIRLKEYDYLSTLDLYATVPASDSLSVIDIPWEKFSWYGSMFHPFETRDEALQNNIVVHLVFWSDSAATGSFKLTKFGSYGSCDGSFVSTPKIKVVSSIQVSKISRSHFSISGLNSETSFRLFDLNGKLLDSGMLKNGGVVNTPTHPVILRLENGAQFLLK